MKKNRFIFKNNSEKQARYSSLLSYIGYSALNHLTKGEPLDSAEMDFLRTIDIYSGVHKYGGWLFDFRSFLDRYFVTTNYVSWYSVWVSDVSQIMDSNGLNDLGNPVRAVVKADKLVYGDE